MHGLADGIFWSGVFAFVSASINAIKTGGRGVIRKKTQPVIKDGVEIRSANRTDFTKEA